MITATERLEMRIQPEEKALLSKAAMLEGSNLSAFVLAPALKRARRIVSESERIATTAQGYRDILDVLAEPPDPSHALRAAMRDYEQAAIEWR